MDFIYQLGGIREDDERMHVQFHNDAGDIEFNPAKARVYDTVTLPKTIFGDHFSYLKSQVTKGVPKLTIPSPSMVHYRSGRPYIDATAYPDMDGFWNDLSAAYAQEIAAAARARLHATCRWTTRASRTSTTRTSARRSTSAARTASDLHLRYIKQINAGRRRTGPRT